MAQEFIPSGSTLLDLVLGGGWAEGKLINLVGDSASGKSLLAIEAAANFSRKYRTGIIHYIDTESAFDPAYAEAVGFPREAQVSMPNKEGIEIATIEGFFEYLDMHVVAGNSPSLIILDSLDGLSDEDEMQRSATDKATYGMGKAKTLSTQLRKYMQKLSKTNSTLMIISQTRDNIGATWGDKKTRSGGKALRFYSSQELWLSLGLKITKTRDKVRRVYGVNIKARTKKNRMAPCPRDCELELHFNYGIEDLMSCANFLGIKVKNLNDMGGEEYNQMLEDYQQQAREKWEDIEEKFSPVRSKYAEDEPG